MVMIGRQYYGGYAAINQTTLLNINNRLSSLHVNIFSLCFISLLLREREYFVSLSMNVKTKRIDN